MKRTCLLVLPLVLALSACHRERPQGFMELRRCALNCEVDATVNGSGHLPAIVKSGDRITVTVGGYPSGGNWTAACGELVLDGHAIVRYEAGEPSVFTYIVP